MQTTVRQKWELTKSVPFIKADTPNGGKANNKLNRGTPELGKQNTEEPRG